MTGFQAIGILIIRLWAIEIILGALSFIAFVPYPLRIESLTQENLLVDAIFNAMWLLVGLGGWVLAPRIARTVLRGSEEDGVSIAIGAREFVAVGSFLIGGFYLVQYLPKIIGRIASISIEMIGRSPDARPTVDPYQFHNLTIEGIIFLVALFLTFRPHDIANMFASLRVAGLSKNVTQNTPPETT